MNAQDIINDCDELFDREEFVKEIREAEFLSDNLKKQEVKNNGTR